MARRIEHKELCRINPEAARVFGVNRPVVYDILKKERQGDLKDRSKAPRTQPNKTALRIEEKVIEAKNKTRLGSKRLTLYLRKYEKIEVAWPTIRNILRRNKHRITYNIRGRSRSTEKRESVEWYSAKPFEIVQMDVKFIRDQKALTSEQMLHLDRYLIPNFQWSAIDVNSRFKLISYSREKTWTNGLCWYLWTISWLRSHGVSAQIIFTVDHGEEFGGKSWLKIRELRKLISGFGCRLIQNHKGHCEENAHLELSHRTDDDEFYIPRVLKMRSESDLLDEALGYRYYYNNVREHSALDYQTPYAYLKKQVPEIHDKMRFVIPVMLDDLSIKMGPWSGYNVLVQNQKVLTFRNQYKIIKKKYHKRISFNRKLLLNC
jgi:putative transposase